MEKRDTGHKGGDGQDGASGEPGDDIVHENLGPQGPPGNKAVMQLSC